MKNIRYDDLTSKYESRMMEKLAEFIAIDSTYDENSKDENNPFGKGVSKALEFIKNLAIEEGFEAKNYDNMVVEIITGKGDKNLTIMAHADIVPVGNGWETDPFKIHEEDGVLYARGVADDKGPLMACFYGLKALLDEGLLGDYQVRFLVGGNEERGSLCMEHYFRTLNKYQPTLGFTPDSDYPLIYAEKGIINFRVHGQIELDNVAAIEGGVASNAVIDQCVATLKKDDEFIKYLTKNNVKFTKDGNNVVFHGLAAHGSMPEDGINAGIIALDCLANFYHNEKLQEFVNRYKDVYGRGINAYNESKDMGKNSMNVGLLSYQNNELSMVVNFRHVDGVSSNDLIDNIKKANSPFAIEVLGISPLLYFPKDSTLVSTLLRVYREETGDLDSEPLAIGGGTYAKEANNIVAFGMQFPGWDSKMHGPGEKTKKADLVKSMSIYAHAIIELGKELEK